MKQLTMGSIMALVKELQNDGMSLREIYDLPIYLGDDDELNGMHCGWYTNLVDANNTEDADNMYLVKMINADVHCIKLDGKAILIS